MAPVLDRITDSITRMSARERLLLSGLAGALAVLLLALISYLILEGLDARRVRNDRIRAVTERLEKNRDRLSASKTEDARMDVKLDRKPPALQSHIEGLAKRFEVEVKDYKPGKDKELGPQKRVLERSVVISLYDIDLEKLTKFLDAVETGGFVILTKELQVTPRSTDHGKLDVQKLEIAAYERNDAPEKKTDKGKDPRPRRSRP